MPTSLHSLPRGASATVLSVDDQPLRVRMASMGIRPGASILVVARSAAGSRVVRVGDARLTIAKELALGIAVEPLHVQ